MALASTDVATGLDLKLLRVERGVTQTALAKQMRVWRQTVSILEGALRPGPGRIERYLRALDEISLAGTPAGTGPETEPDETPARSAHDRAGTRSRLAS